MTTMIERMARAIHASWPEGFGDRWQSAIPQARAALQAMEEPTSFMMGSIKEDWQITILTAWESMIARALSEEQP